MILKSSQLRVGVVGASALLLTCVASGMMRQGDWSAITEFDAWLTGTLVTAFMGLWGFMTLFISASKGDAGASKGLLWLAALYFVVAIVLTADIILNGNSTAGIAFFLYPVFATPVMLVLILLVMLIEPRLARSDGRETPQ